MIKTFKGHWKFTVKNSNSELQQRIKIENAGSGDGIYPATVGNEFVIKGMEWTVTLEWSKSDGSGWQKSQVIESMASDSPLVILRLLNAQANPSSETDVDFQDLSLRCESLNPIFKIEQRPYSIDRETLMMLPDGIFEVSKGIQYMGVKIKNDWFFDWTAGQGFKIGISPECIASLESQGIKVLNQWTAKEEMAFQQHMDDGFVRVKNLKVGQSTTVYFKLDFSNSSYGKPEITFVAQRNAWDSAYNFPSRQVHAKIFVSQSNFDPVKNELVAEIPEGTVYVHIKKVLLDKVNAEKAIAEAFYKPDYSSVVDIGSLSTNKEGLREELKEFIEQILEGKDVDPCSLGKLLSECCECPEKTKTDENNTTWNGPWDNQDNSETRGNNRIGTIKPFAWLPLEFEYRVVPRTPYEGQFGPLAYDDPWWKVILALISAILGGASVAATAALIGSTPQYIIGQLLRSSDRTTSNVDAAIANINGTRIQSFNVLDAQSDDVNNELPIDALDGEIGLNRTPNGFGGAGIASLGDIVFKSGARTATTRGIVDSISFNTSVNFDEGLIPFTGQLRVIQLPAPNTQEISNSGDSGSVWVDMISRRAVGLNFAGSDETEGIANPMVDVVSALNIRF